MRTSPSAAILGGMSLRTIRIASAALAALALLAASAAGAAAKVVPKKPDLVIAGAALKGHPYAFQGERSQLLVHDITRNRGTARAGASITEVSLDAPTLQQFDLARRAVGRLGPAKQSAGDSWRSANYDFPIGSYLIEICADANDQVKESNEDNNCILLRNAVLDPTHLYVIRRVWAGTLGGIAGVGGVFESYHSDNAKVIFDKPQTAADGTFEYDFTGPVKYKDSGSGSGCSYSGGDTQTFGARGATAYDTLIFDYQGRTYAGAASVDGAFYSINVKCGSSSFTEPGPFAQSFLNFDDAEGNASHFPFGATNLTGSSSIPSQHQNWTWGLH